MHYLIQPRDHVPIFVGISQRMLREALAEPMPFYPYQGPTGRRYSALDQIARDALYRSGRLTVGAMEASALDLVPELAVRMATPVLSVCVRRGRGNWRTSGPVIRRLYREFLTELGYTAEQLASEDARFKYGKRPGAFSPRDWDGSYYQHNGFGEPHIVYASTGEYDVWQMDGGILVHGALSRRVQFTSPRTPVILDN